MVVEDACRCWPLLRRWVYACAPTGSPLSFRSLHPRSSNHRLPPLNPSTTLFFFKMAPVLVCMGNPLVSPAESLEPASSPSCPLLPGWRQRVDPRSSISHASSLHSSTSRPSRVRIFSPSSTLRRTTLSSPRRSTCQSRSPLQPSPLPLPRPIAHLSAHSRSTPPNPPVSFFRCDSTPMSLSLRPM